MFSSYCFRRGKSTCDAVLTFTQNSYEALNDKKNIWCHVFRFKKTPLALLSMVFFYGNYTVTVLEKQVIHGSNLTWRTDSNMSTYIVRAQQNYP